MFTTENFSAALSYAIQRPKGRVRLVAADWESVDRARLMVEMLDLAEQILVHHRTAIEHVDAVPAEQPNAGAALSVAMV